MAPLLLSLLSAVLWLLLTEEKRGKGLSYANVNFVGNFIFRLLSTPSLKYKLESLLLLLPTCLFSLLLKALLQRLLPLPKKLIYQKVHSN